MPSFESMFIRSRGQPIEHNGKQLVLADFFPLQHCRTLRLAIESSNGDSRQGVGMRFLHRDKTGKWKKGATASKPGEFIIGGESYSGKQGVRLWREQLSEPVVIGIMGTPEWLEVHNLWESVCYTGVKYVDYGHYGAAMIVDHTPCGRRYRCNDWEPDDDFDDIIFSIERL